MGEIAETLRWMRAVHPEKEGKAAYGPGYDEDVACLGLNCIEEEYAEVQSEPEGVEEAKELADLVWVIIQFAYFRGYPFEEVYAEVARSNWSKLNNGKPAYREDGKLCKGPNYSPADIASVFQAHGR